MFDPASCAAAVSVVGVPIIALLAAFFDSVSADRLAHVVASGRIYCACPPGLDTAGAAASISADGVVVVTGLRPTD